MGIAGEIVEREFVFGLKNRFRSVGDDKVDF